MPKITLIDSARNWWKFYSVQIMGLLAVLALISAQWPDLLILVPEKWRPYCVAIFAIAGIAGKLISQPNAVAEGVAKKLETTLKAVDDLSVEHQNTEGTQEKSFILKELGEKKLEAQRLLMVRQVAEEKAQKK